tara:strand:- start:2010 stop:3131 length:1122 start_codon:yes stop_codon:yes gene_type:complete
MGAVTLDGPTISAEALPLIADAFGASHIDAPRAFDACGLGREAARAPCPDAIPLAQFARLMQCAGDADDDHARLWLSGRAIAGPSLTHLFPAAGAERRLGTLLSRLIAELDALQHGSDFRLCVEGDLCTLAYRIVDPRIWPRSRDAEFTLGFFDAIVRQAAGSHDFLEAVAFEHRRDARGDVDRLTHVPAIFEEQVNLIAFPAGLLDRPVDGGAWRAPGRPDALPARPPEMTTTAPPRATEAEPGPAGCGDAPAPDDRTAEASRADTAPPDVATALYRRIGRGPVSQQQIARDCGLSDRSLRRHLRDKGLSFRALAEAARIDYAEWALEATDLPLAEIAFRAGYADQSAFSRAFRRRTGMAPRQRRLLRISRR